MKKFDKYFKKEKKQLIKYAKEFQAFDYGFMEKLIFQSIKIYYQFFKDPKNLYQDTKCEFNHWEESVKALKRCVEIIDIIENVDWADFEQEKSLKDELYDLIKEHHSNWWD